MKTVTLRLTVSDAERAALTRMSARPEEVGATEGPLRIEAVRDLQRSETGSVVEVVAAVPGGDVDAGEALEKRLRQRMAELASTGAVRG